jgi:hypothetical protein
MSYRVLRAALTVLVVTGTVTGVTLAGAQGRYKQDGKRCYWDAKDNGPDQCKPAVSGRFKKSGDTCTWVTGEKGTDECRPSKGRFKVNGSACEWNATDSGPDQCDPHQVK